MAAILAFVPTFSQLLAHCLAPAPTSSRKASLYAAFSSSTV